MTTTYTHEFHEFGNGFPEVGDTVVCEQDGDIRLVTITGMSRIETRQWHANMVYLTCVDAEHDWDDLTESEQDEMYSGHRVGVIQDERDAR